MALWQAMVTHNISDRKIMPDDGNCTHDTTTKGDRTLPYSGLTSQQVQVNRQKYGTNLLTEPLTQPWWQLYLEKFTDPVIRILMIAAIVAMSVGMVEGQYIEGLGIIVAIFLATTLAFVNEYKANQEFEILNQVYDEVPVKVIRDGNVTTIPRKELVVGDIVSIEQGEEVPADGELLEEIALYIDQSKVTGESEPVKKFIKANTEAYPQEEVTYPPYQLHRGTWVEQGHGWYELTAVGDQTEMGKIATAVMTVDVGEKTPLNIQLERLSKLIGVVGLFFAGLIFVALLIRGLVTGELSLSVQQAYFAGLLIVSVLICLVRVWLPIVYDGMELAGAEVEVPPWLENEGWTGGFKTTGMGIVLLLMGIAVGYPLGLMPAFGDSWLPASAGKMLLNDFMVAVTIIVVAVPEGLAMSVTLSLAYSMRKMAASHNLVRRMHACETIGAATVICSDKTGTLTQNQMRVYEVNFPCLKATEVPKYEYNRSLIAEAIATNSTADLEEKPHSSPRPIGNATEGALLLWLNHHNIDYIPYRHKFPIKFQQPFATQRKYMGTVGTSSVTGGDILYIKGAPEVILERCSQILTEQGSCQLEDKTAILASLNAYQKRGMRTLGFAYREVPQDGTESYEVAFKGNSRDRDGDVGTRGRGEHEGATDECIFVSDVNHPLIWLGFVAISDPLRSEVPEAIEACLKAGIQVKVVTGDNPETVQEIARQIGLWQAEDNNLNPYLHLTGQQFNQLSDEEAKLAVQELKLLSRACPLDKLRLVKLLQENGHIVGVTGDGTNDAAALKQAHVGLAMGSGTAIAKEASDIILLDDSFGSIVNAIVWGRSLYENIQRFILFQLTINVAALGIALWGPFIGVALPLTVTQMLWVNLIMDTFAALALAAEPPHWTVLEHPPRNPEAFIVTPSMEQNIFTTGLGFLIFLVGFLLYLRKDGDINSYQLSVFFTIFVLFQFWNLFNTRCLGLKQSAFSGLLQNKGFLVIATTIFVGQIFIIQWGGRIFRTVPLPWTDWIAIVAATSIVLWIGELWRFILRLKLRNN